MKRRSFLGIIPAAAIGTALVPCRFSKIRVDKHNKLVYLLEEIEVEELYGELKEIGIMTKEVFTDTYTEYHMNDGWRVIDVGLYLKIPPGKYFRQIDFPQDYGITEEVWTTFAKWDLISFSP